MPTDVLLSVAQRRARDKKDAADLKAIVFLVPMIACLLSLSLCVECHAFQCALLQLAAD